MHSETGRKTGETSMEVCAERQAGRNTGRELNMKTDRLVEIIILTYRVNDKGVLT